MPRTRPPYPPEFRQEAVRLLRSGARSTKQLAVELGCSPQTLSNWVRQDQADRGERQDLLSSEERQRLRELERENMVLLDGTKLRANASRHKAMSYERMVKKEAELEAEIAAIRANVRALLEEAEAVDAAEDERYGPDLRGDDLPPDLQRREQRLARIREAKQALEAEAVVDGAAQVIVAAELSEEAPATSTRSRRCCRRTRR